MTNFENSAPIKADDELPADMNTAAQMAQDGSAAETGGRGTRVLMPDAANVLTLPADVSLEDISVNGRDLIIQLADGTKIVVPDGAIIVPQIVIDGVVVPPENVAALLNNTEIQPEAGTPQSSGGNFASDPGAIQAAYAIGDLLPYTELQFPVYPEREIIPNRPSREPHVVVVTPDNPVGDIHGQASVAEAGLPERNEGEPQGTNAASNTEATTGSLVFDTPDGLGSVSVNGVIVTAVGQTIQGQFGTLTITSIAPGVIGYNYVLDDNQLAADVDVFNVVVTDTDGDTATASLTITIVDDAPIAVNDAVTQTAEDAPVTVNVFVNDTEGADGAPASTVTLVNGTLTGKGTLTNNGDGTFTYVPAPGEEGTVTFAYTITDGDGDVSQATVTITLLHDSIPQVGIATDSDTTVDEAALSWGSNPGSTAETATGALTFGTGGDTVGSLVIGGVDVTNGGAVAGAHGTLTVTGNPTDGYTYSYVLTENTNDGAGAETDDFSVVLTDSDGDVANTTLTITIADDVPVAVDDTDSVTEDGPLAASGNVITDAEANGDNGADTRGADGASVTEVGFGDTVVAAGEQIHGLYGTLTLNADGGYTYTLDNSNPLVQGLDGNDTLTEQFDYTLTDGDGDSDPATLTITINGADDSVTITGLDGTGSEEIVDEDDLADGSSPDAAALVQDGTFTIASPDGLATLSVGGTQVYGAGTTYPVTVTGAYGTVQITGVSVTTDAAGDVIGATVSYTYTLSDNTLDHPDAGQDSLVDSFAVLATDSDGSTDTASLDVTVIDDVPQAFDNSNSVVEGGSVEGDVITNPDADGNVDIAGADGFASGGAIVGIASTNEGTSTDTANASGDFVLEGEYGTLTLNADGSYTYVSNPNSTNVDAKDVFTYTVIDGDGDMSTATLTIDIDNVMGSARDDDALVYEAGLPGGSDPTSNSEIDADGHITVTGATGTLTYSIVGPTTGTYGALTLNSATGAYTYTLGTPFTDNDATENTTNTVTGADSFTYEVRDQFNNLVAGGTINVDIVDDVPNAVDEATRTIAEDASAPAALNGNVMDNDTEGADGATVTKLTVGAESVDVPQDGSDATLTTANGTYTMDMDGNWTFDPVRGLNQTTGAVDASFSYTLTDGDDDYDTATQPITITDGAGPTAGLPITLTLDDQNLDDGRTPGGPDSDSDTIVFTPGSDAIASIVFGTDLGDLDPALSWTRAPSGTQIVGTLNGVPIVTLSLTVTGNTASVTATLNDNFPQHPDQGDDLFNLGSVDVVATDTDGDTASAAVTVTVSDDLPTLTAGTPTAGALTVDESDFGTDDTANFSGLFTPDYNADGAGTVGGYTLGINAGATGLVDTASGHAVFLFLEGGAVVGREGTDAADAATGDVVFTVSVDANGVVTLDQDRAVVHTNHASVNEPTTLATANLITLTATITDGDGDTDDATANIGRAITFLDDGPTIDASANANTTVTLITQDADTIGTNSDIATSSANFGGAFSVVSSSFGADGPGTISWAYSLTIDNVVSGLMSNGVSITLAPGAGGAVVGSANGTPVFQISVNPATGVVTLTQYAEIDHSLPGSTTGYDLQTAILGDGIISLSGKATITDGDQDSFSETVKLDLGGNIAFADDGPDVTLTGTAPALVVDETNLGTNAVAEFGDIFSFNFGADGPGAGGGESFALSVSTAGAVSGLTDTATGHAVYLFLEGGQVVGREGSDALAAASGAIVFTVSVDGDGTVTLDQQRAIIHPTGGPSYDEVALPMANSLITLTATGTDGDGDSDTASVNIGSALTFHDDGPNIEVSLASDVTVLLQTHDANTDGDPTQQETTSTAGFANLFSFTPTPGADGVANVPALSYSLGAAVGASGLTSHGAVISLAQLSNGTVVGYTGSAVPTVETAGSVVFSVKVASDGSVTLVQYQQVDHATPGATGSYDTQFASLLGGKITLTASASIIDKDGDTDTDSKTLDIGANIRFLDDGPTGKVVVATGQTDDEGKAPFASLSLEGGTGDVTGSPATLTGVAGSLFVTGADGLGSITVTGPAGLKAIYDAGSDGHAEQEGVDHTTTINSDGSVTYTGVGAVSHETVFTLTINADGSYSFTQDRALVHSGTGEDDLSIKFDFVVRDFDQDMSSGSLTISVDDDTPVANTVVATPLTDDEGKGDFYTSSIEGGTGDVAGNPSTVAGAAGALFTAGADGFGSVSITGPAGIKAIYDIGSGSGTTGDARQEALTYSSATAANGAVTLTATGTVSNAVAFTLTVNNDGSYTFTQMRALVHSGAGEDNLPLNFGFTVTDGDGDTAASTLTINVDDDTPTNFTPVAAAGINTGTAVITAALDTAGSGIFDNAGADGIGSITFATMAAGAKLTGTAGVLQSGGQDIYLYNQPNGSLIASTDADPTNGLAAVQTVFTATLDAGTGKYTIDFDRAIDNGSGVKVSDFSATKAGQNDWNGVDPDLVNGKAIDIGASNDPNPDSTDLLFTPSPGASINTSSTDIGVDNQIVNTGEGVRIDLVQDLRRDPGQTEADAGGYLYDDHDAVSAATFTIMQTQGNGTASVRITASNVNDTNLLSQSNVGAASINTAVNLDHTSVIVKNAAGVVQTTGFTIYNDGNAIVVSGLDAGDTVTFGAEAAATFESFTVANAAGQPIPGGSGNLAGTGFGLGAFAYSFVALGTPVQFTLPVVLTDGDGDTSTGSIAVSLNPVTPVVLDLDGDGVEFAAMSAGAAFDYNGDGNLAATAWAGTDDGILALDANGNGRVDNGSEIVFGANGLTDLEGLAANYDSNHDGVLDANDADFAKFGVWQDADGDGSADAGEFHTLAELGIASLSLTSDGVAYTAADGEVRVAGTTTFVRADGSVGTAADAAFAVSPLDKDATRTADVVAASVGAAGVAAAVAAASYSLPLAAAETVDAPTEHDSGPVTAPTAYEPSAPVEGVDISEIVTSATAESPPAKESNILGGHDGEANLSDGVHLAGHESDAGSVVYDFGASNEFGHFVGGLSATAIEGVDGSAAMEALLIMAAPVTQVAANDTAEAAGTIEGALSDFAAEQVIENLVDHFQQPGTHSLAAGAAGGFDADALSQMLHSGMGPMGPVANGPDLADQLALSATATAHA